MKIAKSRARSRVTSSSVARRLTSAISDQQRAGAEQDREHVGALLADLVVGQLAHHAGGLHPLGDGGAVGPGRERGHDLAVAEAHGRRERVAVEDQHLAVVVGLDVAADERERHRLPAGADGQRVADVDPERVVEAAAGDRLAGAREHAAVGHGVVEAWRRRPRGPGRADPRRADLEPGDRRRALDGGSSRTSSSAAGGPSAPGWTLMSYGFARSAGSSITRLNVASAESAATSVITMIASAATVSVARERLVNASLTPSRAAVGEVERRGQPRGARRLRRAAGAAERERGDGVHAPGAQGGDRR